MYDYNWIGSKESTLISETICIMNVLSTAGEIIRAIL